MSTVTSESVRGELVEALRLDLIGPDNDHPFARELLPEPPSRWYLTGFLVPAAAPVERRMDAQAQEQIDFGDDTGGTDDAGPPEKAAARRGPFPSSIGLTALIPQGIDELRARVEWGDYALEPPPGEPAADEGSDGAGAPVRKPAPIRWRRTPRCEPVTLDLRPGRPTRFPVRDSAGLELLAVARPVAPSNALPDGARSVSVFLVNRRGGESEDPDPTWAFQAALHVDSPAPFVPRPDLRGDADDDIADEWEERVADLHYRDTREYAVGHGVAVCQRIDPDGACRSVGTNWIPRAEVERVAPAAIPGAELGMEALGALADAGEAEARLSPIVEQYRAWIADRQGDLAGLAGRRADTARDLLTEANQAAERIAEGIRRLHEPDVLTAFRVANRAMARAARQRDAARMKVRPDQLPPPAWRPFQLGFILLALSGMDDATHDDRDIVDLLFFPTGGGKTEAYLGLAAYTMVRRRLRHRGADKPRYAGVSVLMRYTLRLLTLDQLSRAAGLVCALELEREQDVENLGTWPFEIGLWVGSAATPNRMGGKGWDGPGREYTAYIKDFRYKSDSKRNPAPIPLQNCPWCGAEFKPESFHLVGNIRQPTDLRVHCVNPRCEFSGGRRSLPIVSVDEPIYRRLPAFLIATVDKFAALPWTGPTGALFGHVSRFNADGFYGPCDPSVGSPLDGPLPPPDLIIQDELHLISGPLGTIAGVYEAAIDQLASRQVGGKRVRPKIVASTATVRRADKQIRALFEHERVAIFPPPGVSRRDTFFSITEPPEESPARLYVGIAAPGRSLKVAMLRTYLALLSAAQRLYEREGGDANPENPVDPYMTLLGYFNSLRELGGSRRIVEDEVVSRLKRYHRHCRIEPEDRLFQRRTADYEPVELTSRVSTNDVATAKQRLERAFRDKGRVDIALATNMISVGLDITRLGLMVVLGQPKTSAEYIQTTSRVGRDRVKPGLVITLLNVHKPRDRSHYERFSAYHASFYRAVEPTSVTPFAPRALDRALPAALVAMSRHGRASMTPPQGAGQVVHLRDDLRQFALRLAERARNHAHPPDPDAVSEIGDTVQAEVEAILDDWLHVAEELQSRNVALQYQTEKPGAGQRLLYDFLDPEVATLSPARRRFRAGRSMRDVGEEVEMILKTPTASGGTA